MQTRRDQVQAHLFLGERLVSALVQGEADAAETPTRRVRRGVLVGVLAAVAAVVGFAVYGIFSPAASTAWREPGALIVEKETGTRYVFLDGKLWPVVNYASARLILGRDPQVVSVTAISLRGTPRGDAIGIPGAPDTLPDVATAGRWLACARIGSGVDGARRARVVLELGTATELTTIGDAALLLVGPDGTHHLAWRDKRMRVNAPSVLDALGFASVPATPVAASWLSALPVGPDLAAPAVERRGEPGPAVGGLATVVGQVLAVGDERFVVLPDGLAPSSATDAALLLADPTTAAAYPGGQVRELRTSVEALARAPRSARSLATPGFPASPPRPLRLGGDRAPCLELATTGGNAVVRLGSAPVPKEGARPLLPAGAPIDPRAADEVLVPPGGGVLVRELPATGVTTGTLELVTDTGTRYPLASAEAAEALGYDAAAAVPVPSVFLALLPSGPSLDPATARDSVVATRTTKAPA